MFGGPFEQRARLFGRVGRDFHQHPSPFQLLRAARLTTGKWGRQRHTNMSACRVFYKSLAMHFSYVMRQPNPQKGLCTTIDSPHRPSNPRQVIILPIQGPCHLCSQNPKSSTAPQNPRGSSIRPPRIVLDSLLARARRLEGASASSP